MNDWHWIMLSATVPEVLWCLYSWNQYLAAGVVVASLAIMTVVLAPREVRGQGEGE